MFARHPTPISTPERRKFSLLDLQRESDVYSRIAGQPHFLKMIEFSTAQGIVLQGLPNGTLRQYLQTEGPQISNSQRLGWARSIASALRSLHVAKVVHADAKLENVLLDEESKAYLIDFSGSWIDGKPGSAIESVRFFLPRDVDSDSTVQTDLFSLGSTIYEVMTGTQPYHDRDDEVVEERFQQGHFPCLDEVPCGPVIKKCWAATIHTVDEVILALQDESATAGFDGTSDPSNQVRSRKQVTSQL
ncbi:hypothetical protein LTR62_007182 [Meristemomyces frigidus]|uniref:Protein kinase domain-containing protein n=1 Tax=Meristemomyces frigidus TaxID=1508187 RepID=A0AAN7YMI0_9PEZI|nr:hypothetical protein LTR62_007182 [Meristemomyces frigidus]